MKIESFYYYKNLMGTSNFKWCTNNNKILILLKHSAAYWLAFYSDITGWNTDDERILKLKNRFNKSVVEILTLTPKRK